MTGGRTTTPRGRATSIAMGTAAAALLLTLTAAPAWAQQQAQDERVTAGEHVFDIAAQPLGTAILRFSDQADVQLVIDAAIAADVSANAVSGRLSLEAALTRLLAGTGLRWRYLTRDTITILRDTPPSPMATQAAAPVTPRIFAPVRVEGQMATDPLPMAPNGSSDPTATEGSGSLAAALASVASKRPRPLLDTPQTVSVLTHARIEQMNLTDLNSALQQMPGVSTRTIDGISGPTFLSRGFEIQTLLFDGGGPTFYQSRQDAAIRPMLETPELAQFDHIEILRGSAGLFGGIGYPGGVINLQRKRPLETGRLSADLSAGSWNRYRVELDATGPLAFDGALRARAVGVVQDRDFFYDIASERRRFGYAIVEADIGADVTIRGGGSYRTVKRPGFNLNGLPRLLDGGDLRLPRETCLCAPWNRYAASQSEQFLAGEWHISSDWTFAANASRKTQDADFLAAAPLGITEEGSLFFLIGVTAYRSRIRFDSLDASLSGEFRLAGMKAHLTGGIDYVSYRPSSNGGSVDGGGVPLDYLPEQLEAISDLGNRISFANSPPSGSRQLGIYGTAAIDITNRISAEFGMRGSFYSQTFAPFFSGNAGPATYRFSGRLSPSFFLSLAPDDYLRVHIGYSKIFQPQLVETGDGNPLRPATGGTYEANVKWAKGATTMTAAAYYAQTRNLLRFVPTNLLCCYQTEKSARSYGIDLEIAGKVLPNWDIQASYNWNRNRYGVRSPQPTVETQQPRHMVKLWTAYTKALGEDRLELGAGIRLESERYSRGAICIDRINPFVHCLTMDSAFFLKDYRYRQPLYAIADLRIGYSFNQSFETALNLTNITNTRYYETVGTPASGNYYGEPRAFTLSFKAFFGNRPNRSGTGSAY